MSELERFEPMAAERPGNHDFEANLRYLCSYYRSISDVCRRLGINRQQFNKYIAGTARPSSHNLKKICDFFGVEEYEILFPHSKLRALVELKGLTTRTHPEERPWLGYVEEVIDASDPDVEKYLGCYFKYYYSFSYPGKILKSLLVLRDIGGVPAYKCVERLVDQPKGQKRDFVFKYVGAALFLRERIFMIDRESLTGNEISQTILYPSYKNKVSELAGLMIGTSGKMSREPICSRVLLQYLGLHIDLSAAMRLCGLYDAQSPDIDDGIRNAIDNRIAGHEYALRALPR